MTVFIAVEIGNGSEPGRIMGVYDSLSRAEAFVEAELNCNFEGEWTKTQLYWGTDYKRSRPNQQLAQIIASQMNTRLNIEI